MFKLNETLKKDTFFVKDLQLCQLLLMNNEYYPWFILVPKRVNLVEIFDLELSDQQQLTKEINLIAKLVKEYFNADKINIASLGNMVSQLHIHIIARFKNDRIFPNPVWNDDKKQQYQNAQEQKIITDISNLL